MIIVVSANRIGGKPLSSEERNQAYPLTLEMRLTRELLALAKPRALCPENDVGYRQRTSTNGFTFNYDVLDQQLRSIWRNINETDINVDTKGSKI